MTSAPIYRDLESAFIVGFPLLVHDLQHAGLLDEGLLVEPAALALRLRLVADDHLEGSKSSRLSHNLIWIKAQISVL